VSCNFQQSSLIFGWSNQRNDLFVGCQSMTSSSSKHTNICTLKEYRAVSIK